MIIVGINIESINCAGYSCEFSLCFDCIDYHEAAIETIKCQNGTPWISRFFRDGEFHDTQTNRTWHVDSGGHTKKDYRYESEKDFRKRWARKK